MQSERNFITVRVADFAGPDRETVSRLVEAYLRQTETEKANYLKGVAVERDLPERYRAEVDDPARTYESAVVYIAELDQTPVGVVVVQLSQAAYEIKRVWSDPAARGRGVGSAMLDIATSRRDLPIRLTVWDWREDAVRLYRRRGFVHVASWEEPPRLLCMELRQASR